MRGKVLIVLALEALLTPLAALPVQAATSCLGVPSTMTALPGVPTHGTAGPDVIVGTAGDDIIYGNGGPDRICGLGGNDTIWGGPGRDRIDGGDGDDVVNAGGGQNQMARGGEGNDIIRSSGEDSKAYGGTGRDTVTGKQYGNFQEIYGGPGDDHLFARTGNLYAYGGPGDDVLRSSAAFVLLRGEDGNDRIYSGYRNDLDAGDGFDRCSLDMTVADTGCERVTLLCGSGGDDLPAGFPGSVSDPTTAVGDFDGNGVNDTLYVWRSGSTFYAHVETDGGFGAEATWPHPIDGDHAAWAIGGHDINGDGIDEAFVVTDSFQAVPAVGIFTLWEAVGSPTTGFSCALRQVWHEGTSTEAEFPIQHYIYGRAGLECRGNHTLREFDQTYAGGVIYTQIRHDYRYFPSFGSGDPILSLIDTTTVNVSSVENPAQFALAGQFTCDGLSLYP